MKTLFLLLVLAAGVGKVSADEPPANYMDLKAKFKRMDVKEENHTFIRKQVIIGVATGTAMFALNEYFIWSQNEAFHNVMPYVAVAYTIYQTVNIILGKSMGEVWDVPDKGGGLTLYVF